MPVSGLVGLIVDWIINGTQETPTIDQDYTRFPRDGVVLRKVTLRVLRALKQNCLLLTEVS